MTATWQLLILFVTGLAAGFVDSIAGGGGLITLPVVLGLGLPPPVALGTNKLQATFGSGSATWHFIRSGTVHWRSCWQGIIATTIGATGGVLAVQQIQPALLKLIIPYCLLGIALFTFFSPRMGYHQQKPRMGHLQFHLLFGLLLGFYDGFFGPGTGTFWAIVFVVGLGYNLVDATGYTKVMNFTSNLVSLGVFMMVGYVAYLQGFVMAAGQMLGARLGSGLVIKKGARFVRPIFITMALVITLKLISDNFR
jgi:uncharacterized protein